MERIPSNWESAADLAIIVCCRLQSRLSDGKVLFMWHCAFFMTVPAIQYGSLLHW